MKPNKTICKNCKGSGTETIKTDYSSITTICHQCSGRGELDWIENITGMSNQGSDEWKHVECVIDLEKAEEKFVKIPLPNGMSISMNFDYKGDVNIKNGDGNNIFTTKLPYSRKKITFGCHVKVSGKGTAHIATPMLVADG